MANLPVQRATPAQRPYPGAQTDLDIALGAYEGFIRTGDECYLANLNPDELRALVPVLAGERRFWLDRIKAASWWLEGGKERDRWWGTSSDALIVFAVDGTVPPESQYPRDPSDLASCVRTFDRLPEHLKTEATGAILQAFREHVARGYPNTTPQ